MNANKLRKSRLTRRRRIITSLRTAASAKYPCVFGPGGLYERDESEFAISRMQIKQYEEARKPIASFIRRLYEVNEVLGLPRDRLTLRGVDVSAIDLRALTAEVKAQKDWERAVAKMHT